MHGYRGKLSRVLMVGVVMSYACASEEHEDVDNADYGQLILESPLRIYMRANGSDLNSGLTESQSVRNLWRVQEILKNLGGEGLGFECVADCGPGDESWWAVNQNRNVEVHISPAVGKYYGQSLYPGGAREWTLSNAFYSIKFMPLNGYDGVRPIFNGCAGSSGPCLNSTFFRIDKSGRTNIIFHYIHVEQYNNGIVFVGPTEGANNEYNAIYGSKFYQIGDAYTQVTGGVEAVAFQNSSNNSVENTHFVQLNRATAPRQLHAIYIAHDSDSNHIRGNRFAENTGTPVRVRDGSDYNNIVENTFIKVGPEDGAAFEEWFDRQGTGSSCADELAGDGNGEGCSCENQFRYNSLDGNWLCHDLPAFTYVQYPHDIGGNCGTALYRLHTGGNIRTEDPC
jgi:hypothetical protein